MEAFVSINPPGSTDSEVDKVLAAINAGLSGYLNPPGPGAAAPVATATTAPKTDFVMLAVIAIALYFVLK